jgi:hypothetical protein
LPLVGVHVRLLSDCGKSSFKKAAASAFPVNDQLESVLSIFYANPALLAKTDT